MTTQLPPEGFHAVQQLPTSTRLLNSSRCHRRRRRGNRAGSVGTELNPHPLVRDEFVDDTPSKKTILNPFLAATFHRQYRWKRPLRPSSSWNRSGSAQERRCLRPAGTVHIPGSFVCWQRGYTDVLFIPFFSLPSGLLLPHSLRFPRVMFLPASVLHFSYRRERPIPYAPTFVAFSDSRRV